MPQKKKGQPSIARVSCGHFYLSCECVFNPRLVGRPLVILSNTDGAAISISNEARKCGVSLGMPFLQVREFSREQGVIALSANDQLYADMSSRMMDVLRQFSPNLKLLAAGDCLLDLSHLPNALIYEYARGIQEVIESCLGLSAFIGVGNTGARATFAMKAARHSFGERGIFVLPSENLASHSISSVMMVQNEAESIADAALYQEKTSSLDTLRESVALLALGCGEKLRYAQLKARAVMVYVESYPFLREGFQRQNTIIVPVHAGVQHTKSLMHAAITGLNALYEPQSSYAQVGVVLLDVQPLNHFDVCFSQATLQKSELKRGAGEKNTNVKRRAIHFLEAGARNAWISFPQRKSPCYTTSWDELLTVS